MDTPRSQPASPGSPADPTAGPVGANPHAPSPADVERQFVDARRRAHRHWYDDGLAEMAIGAVFAACGLYFAVSHSTAGTRESTGSVVANLLLVSLVVVVGLAQRAALKRAKERYVYPRVGFVTYPNRRRLPRAVVGVIVGATVGMVTALVRRATPGIETWFPALQGFLVAAFFLWLGRVAGLARLSLLGLLSALAGTAVSLWNPPPALAAGAFFGAVGAALLASGALAFRRFVRGSSPQEEL